MNYTVHGIFQASILEWEASPFSGGFSQTQVSHIVGGFFTSWAVGEAQEYWSGQPTPSPADLSNPDIKPRSSALQLYSLPTELSQKPDERAYKKDMEGREKEFVQVEGCK